VPVACVRRTGEALERAYAHRGVAERFRLVIFPGRGHNLGDDSADEALAWWQRWLTPDAPPVSSGEPPDKGPSAPSGT
jgi:hypothetical protein